MYAGASPDHREARNDAAPEYVGPNGHNVSNGTNNVTDEDAPIDADFAFVDDKNKA